MDGSEQLSIWDFLSTEAGEDDVEIKGALNVHAKGKIKPFEVHLCTGDLVLIVAMIEDYIKGLDVIRADDIQWQVYYRNKFHDLSVRIQNQIEYDYEKARQRCMKKREKEDDIGEEAMALTIKKAMREAEAKEAEMLRKRQQEEGGEEE